MIRNVVANQRVVRAQLKEIRGLGRVMPSAVKKAKAAARSTTTLTWSILLIVMSLG